MKAARVLAALVLAATLVRAEDPAVEEAVKLEKQIRATADKVVPAFVFLPNGSGVLISSDGWFLSNWHVVANIMSGNVEEWTQRCSLPDGSFHVFDVVGLDQVGDIALCRIRNVKDLPFAELGDSDAIRTGEAVLAVGNPFLLGSIDYHPTVTLGIVSGRHRFQGGYSDAIQTDASVNPGNSGGPLFSIEGKLLGINGRIAPRFGNRVNSGIGYAIPINQVKNYMRLLKKGGFVPRPTVRGLYLNDNAAEQDGTGARVRNVTKDSTAEKAGFQKGDVIVELQGYKVHNNVRWFGVLGTYPGGTKVTAKVKRGGEDVEVRITLDKEYPPAAKQVADLGATFEDDAESGALTVLKVSSKSDAAKKGLKVGDVILKFNGAQVKDAEALKGLLKKRLPNQIVPLVVEREGKELDLEIRLGKK